MNNNQGYYYTSKQYLEKLQFKAWVNSLESNIKTWEVLQNYNIYNKSKINRKN